MTRKQILWLSVSFLLTVLLACSGSDGLDTGQAAPDFEIDVNGQVQAVSDYRDRVLLIGFWASTCEPCQEELPVLNELAQEYAQQGVAIWAVNVGEEKETYRKFVESVSYPYLIWGHDARGEAGRLYRVRSIPALYIVDQQGVIRYRQIGYGPGSKDQIRDQIDALLKP